VGVSAEVYQELPVVTLHAEVNEPAVLVLGVSDDQASPLPPPAFATAVTPDTEEVRLATTMTGGVSLAVWMGSVAREIDLLMQASRARRAVPNPDILYTRLLDLLDILVEVDVLSGTSAGGINAVLLAYVRARHGDLSKLRDGIVNLFGPASGGDHPVRFRR
jgi:hypothetical protein